jgi:hypothetical protein
MIRTPELNGKQSSIVLFNTEQTYTKRNIEGLASHRVINHLKLSLGYSI